MYQGMPNWLDHFWTSKIGRWKGKKGSQKVLKWGPEQKAAFENLKKAMLETLELWQIQVDQQLILECDANNYAVGAVLKQHIKGSWTPLPFFSRLLISSQKMDT